MKKTTAYARKRRHAPGADNFAGLRTLDYCRPYEAADTVDRHLRNRAAMDRLQQGTATTDDFDTIAMALNVCKIRAIEIDEALANDIEAAQTAMTDIRERFHRIGRWGFTAQQLGAVTAALQAYEAIHDASSPMQMQQALVVVHQSIVRQIGQAQ